MNNFCQISTIFGKSIKIRKTPYKWAIKVSKMNPKILTRRIVIDDLSSQKRQNALKTGGGVIENLNAPPWNRRFKCSFWFILADSGWFWLILAHFGLSGLILVHSGSFWFILAHSGSVWLDSGSFWLIRCSGSFWLILAYSGSGRVLRLASWALGLNAARPAILLNAKSL